MPKGMKPAELKMIDQILDKSSVHDDGHSTSVNELIVASKNSPQGKR